MRGAGRWAAALALAVLGASATAHPVDEVVQGAYLTLAPGEVRLELDIGVGSEVAGAVLADLDPDGDGTITEDEARAFARGVLDRSTLTLDGAELPWTLLAVSPPDAGLLASGNEVVRIEAAAERAQGEGERSLTYETRYRPARSLWMANVFLQPGDGPALAVTGQERSDDGSRLAVSYTEGAR